MQDHRLRLVEVLVRRLAPPHFLTVRRQLDLLQKIAHLLNLPLEVSCLFLCLDLQSLNLVVGFIPLLVGIVGFLDDVGHLLPLLVEFFLELLVEVIKDDPFAAEAVDDALEVLVVGGGLVELLVGLVEPVLEYLDLLVEVVLAFGAGVHAEAVLAFFGDLLLEVGDMHFDVFLGLSLVFDRRIYLRHQLLLRLALHPLRHRVPVLVHLRLH